MLKSLLSALLVALAVVATAQSSVLRSGTWYKVAVTKDGVYKLTGEQLRKMGFNNPASNTIRVFGQDGGMVPQANDTPRPDDLVELSIFVNDGGDGKFDRSDYILFYAEGPDKSRFIPQKEIFYYENNLYADQNFYFVTAGDQPGKRINSVEAGSGGSLINTFNDFHYHEEDYVNVLRSGREWFGENFELNPIQEFSIAMRGIVPGSEIKLVSEVMAATTNQSTYTIRFNDEQVGIQAITTIPGTQYGDKGRLRRDTLSFLVQSPKEETQKVSYTYTRGSSGNAYLNYFSVHVLRSLSLYGDQTKFRNVNAINGSFRYELANMRSSSTVWNITDPYAPAQQAFDLNGTTATFTSNAGSAPPEFIAFNDKVASPELVGTVANQNLRGQSTPQLVIVTHPTFRSEAERLAEHRSSYNGMATLVVSTEEIYNEFSSGRQDVSAIRDFVRHLYLKTPGKLRSVLLFGRGTYDYKSKLRPNASLVPVYQSRNSLSPLETYSSDDFYGFMDSNEGLWTEGPSGYSHTMDLGVGRLPVKTADEARIIVDKLIEYDTNEKRFGKWRKDFVFVADDGSRSDGFTVTHQSQADAMAENIEAFQPQFNTRKIFLGAYNKIVSPNGETIPSANKKILEEFSDAVIINYTGHGSERLWADERVLTPEDIASMKNRVYPFLVTATCEFGRNDDPLEISSAELSILKERAGSIGLVTTARPVNSSTNFSLNLAFYEALFGEEDSRLSIGEVFRRTKNNSISGVANRNFSLLGDPSMVLALPSRSVVADEIVTEGGSSVLKALSRVTVRGRVLDSEGATDSNFNGVVHTTVFDKRTKFRTVGANNPPLEFEQWFNPLFRGEASVKDGEFEINFIVPKNIAYEVGSGKLSLYAHDTESGNDASGASTSFQIGGSEVSPAPDTQGPQVRAFIGDESFIDGGVASPNTTLVVKLSDESGINVSSYGIGNTMMAILDNDAATYLINEYFTATRDDFTKGTVEFPLYDLPPGKHTLTVRAWDTYNNPGEHTIAFEVTDSRKLVIETFANFPNPFSSQTTVYFTHNRAGEDLLAELTLLNAAGMEIKTVRTIISESPYQVNLLHLDDGIPEGQKNLAPGLYFGRLKVRSLSDGAESTGVTKLILAN